MATLYVTEQGCKLRKASRRLIVEKEGTTLAEVPLFQVDRVVILGAVQISTQAMTLLLDGGIDVSFLSVNGRLRGRLVSSDSKNVFLRLAQHDRARSEAFKLRTAKGIIRAKIRNQRTLLYRYQRNHPDTADFAPEVATISALCDDLEQKGTIAALMGVEGAGTGAYFRAFGRMMTGEFRFEGRTRHPPLDPVNALLSLGYAMVTNELASLLEANGFDPFIGFLHGLQYGRRSLPLDLVEEFRHPVVDTLTLSLLNKRQFTADDFIRGEGGAYVLTKEAFKRYLASYEEQLSMPRGDEAQGYRMIFRAQVEKLEKAVMNDAQYEPYEVR